MSRTFVKQNQMTGSVSVTDSLSLTADVAVSGTLEDNLNALRTAVRVAIGAPAYDGTSGTGFWHTASANGVSLAGIATDISGTWKVNSLFVSGAGTSTVSGTLDVEALNVTGSAGLTVSNGMTITGNVFEMTGSMIVSGTLAVTGAYEHLVVAGDPATYFQVSSSAQNEHFSINNNGASGKLSFEITGSQVMLTSDALLLGYGTTAGTNAVQFDAGAGTYTAWSTEFPGTPSLLDAIVAVSVAASGAGGGGPVNYVSASIKGVIGTTIGISSGSATGVSVYSGSTGCTFVTPTHGGDPAADMDIFVNGVLMSGSNLQTNAADWYWDSGVDYAEGAGANTVNFSFPIVNTDSVQVVLRKFQAE